MQSAVGTMSEIETVRVRSVFLSDLHLGSRACKADLILEFLRQYDAETIFLVGDIIDGWRLRKSWFWPQDHNDVVQKLLRKVRKGSRIVYVPGNHDEFLRDYVDGNFGGIEIKAECIHEAADGRRYLVVHGDKYDVVVANIRWLAHLGDKAYDAAIALNTLVGMVRRRMGLPYWSFSGWGKSKVKTALNYISAFERAVAADVRKLDVDGVICGHIHKAAHTTTEDGILYLNCGDWVDSCTALVERFDGAIEIVEWAAASKRYDVGRRLALAEAA